MSRCIFCLSASAGAVPAGACVMLSCIAPTLAHAEAILLPEVVVTANRIETPVEQLGSAVTVITAEQLEERQIKTVAEALRSVPGVAVSRSGGAGGQTYVRMRGAEANQSLVLIDGVRVNNPDGNGFDLYRLSTLDVERIEVVRGPSSVLWGSSAIGGVVNIITKRAREAREVHWRVEGGSHDSVQLAGSAGSRSDRYDVLLSASHLETEGESAGSEWRGNSEKDGVDLQALSLNAGWQANEMLSFRVGGNYQDGRNEFDGYGALPNPVPDADASSDVTEKSLNGSILLSLLDGAWDHTLTLARYDIESQFYDSGMATFLSENDRQEVAYQSDYHYQSSHWGGSEHVVTALVEYRDEISKNDFFKENAIDNLAYALNYSLGVADRVFLTAGIRRDNNDIFENSTTYRVTGAYLLHNETTRLHASYGKAAKNPTMTELYGFGGDFVGNPDLRPESGYGWDLGIEREFWSGRVVTDVTYFDARTEDLIAGAGASVINLDGTSQSRGIEWAASASLNAQTDARMSYTYTDAEDPQGEALTRRARHLASVGVGHRFLADRASANVTVRYNGSQYDSAFDPVTYAETREKLDSFTVVDLAGSYRLSERVDLFGRVDNLFDEEYEEVLGYGGTGRGLYVGLKGQF